MGRLSGLTDTLNTLLGELGIVLPPWAAPAILVALMVLFFPRIRRNMRTGQARNLVARIRTADHTERPLMKQQVLEMVEDNPTGLVAIADEAIRRGLSDLARDALARLQTLGGHRADVLRLTRELLGPSDGTPEEAILAIERLVEANLVDAARARWERASRQFPSSAALQEWGSRLGTPASAGPRQQQGG